MIQFFSQISYDGVDLSCLVYVLELDLLLEHGEIRFQLRIDVLESINQCEDVLPEPLVFLPLQVSQSLNNILHSLLAGPGHLIHLPNRMQGVPSLCPIFHLHMDFK